MHKALASNTVIFFFASRSNLYMLQECETFPESVLPRFVAFTHMSKWRRFCSNRGTSLIQADGQFSASHKYRFASVLFMISHPIEEHDWSIVHDRPSVQMTVRNPDNSDIIGTLQLLLSKKIWFIIIQRSNNFSHCEKHREWKNIYGGMIWYHKVYKKCPIFAASNLHDKYFLKLRTYFLRRFYAFDKIIFKLILISSFALDTYVQLLFMYKVINRIFIRSISEILLERYNQNKYNYVINLSRISAFYPDLCPIASRTVVFAFTILNVSSDLSSIEMARDRTLKSIVCRSWLWPSRWLENW